MKIKLQNSLLLIIDIQEKLQPAIKDHEDVLASILWAVDLASTMGIPVWATEHCPEKIGFMPEVLRSKIDEKNIISKVHFSGVAEGNLTEQFEPEKNQIIVTGTEAHVCVLQTVLDLLEKKFSVFVLDSGIGSRKDEDKESAIERMRQNGAEIITREMLAFEWLNRADHELFREILNKFIK
ncbi:Nicotinamidase-related amidase [Chryseobacterium arachidis]|uniref:Nicotinamidase-related amidase n=1 Tax=Chryseobacterium arachidis TaxID=1416778 RepID=A0A1M5KKK8_9FLAO|nr:isochorismatase family protein [Chryseobacterium arachidis]SHG53296.1 Nicotinamidase-related amidase [Chryseobacterium arachidis]